MLVSLSIENWTDGANGKNYEFPQKCEFFQILWVIYYLGS